MTFGDAFLRNYFVAFDKVNNRIAYSTFIILFIVIFFFAIAQISQIES